MKKHSNAKQCITTLASNVYNKLTDSSITKAKCSTKLCLRLPVGHNIPNYICQCILGCYLADVPGLFHGGKCSNTEILVTCHDILPKWRILSDTMRPKKTKMNGQEKCKFVCRHLTALVPANLEQQALDRAQFLYTCMAGCKMADNQPMKVFR